MQPRDDLRDIRLEQLDGADWSGAASGPWRNADDLWQHLTGNTNIVRAATEFPWTAVVAPGAAALDLGCGSGWLSGLLSARPDVRRVTAWDGSARMLTELLPRMVELTDGDPSKIERVCGTFTPLLVADSSYDLVVMSSAFHHCDDPEVLLDEIRRVLRPSSSSALVLLNETPWHTLLMASFIARMTGTAIARIAGSSRRFPGALLDDRALYDGVLGDHAWTMKGWRSLAQRTGWSLAVEKSGLYSYPESFRRPFRFESELTHFVLRPL